MNYATTVKNSRLQVVADAVDAGAGPGVLEIGTTSMGIVLFSISLADPCGTVSAGVLTFTTPRTDASADATGTAAEARIRDSDSNVIVSGLTVGLAATDVVISALSISMGQAITLSSATITHA